MTIIWRGRECYAKQDLEDSFLLAPADGRFQVGELAKCYFPGGHETKTLDYEQALIETNKLLQADRVILYEAASATGKPYLYDVAFQRHASNQALPQVEVSAHLMMADKSAVCPTDGLNNQKFRLTHDGTGRKGVIIAETLLGCP